MSALSEDVALRIGLAAKVIPSIAIADLLQAIIVLVGTPLTVGKLNKLRLNKLKQASIMDDFEDEQIAEILAFLKGRNIQCEPEPLPEITLYREGDLPESIRVACASNNGSKIDGHFGSAARYLIYQINAEEKRLIDIRTPEEIPEGEDKNVYRAQLINDCQILYTMSIGGPAAAKVVRAGLHPIKIKNGDDAEPILSRLQETLAGLPPPWLAKVMGSDPEERIRFREGVGR